MGLIEGGGELGVIESWLSTHFVAKVFYALERTKIANTTRRTIEFAAS